MEIKTIAYKQEEGGVAIMTIVPSYFEEVIKALSELEENKKKSKKKILDLAYDFMVNKDVPRVIDNKVTAWHPEEMEREDYEKYELVEYKLIDDPSVIPEDRTFRDAWDFDFNEDLEKSKEIHKKNLRVERAELFEVNDLLLRDAQLEDDPIKKKKGLKERDRLRDITKEVDKCKNTKELRKIKAKVKSSEDSKE